MLHSLIDRVSTNGNIVNRGIGTCLDSGGDATVGARVKRSGSDGSTDLQWTITAV
jgi:alpha-L-fucosidase